MVFQESNKPAGDLVTDILLKRFKEDGKFRQRTFSAYCKEILAGKIAATREIIADLIAIGTHDGNPIVRGNATDAVANVLVTRTEPQDANFGPEIEAAFLANADIGTRDGSQSSSAALGYINILGMFGGRYSRLASPKTAQVALQMVVANPEYPLTNIASRFVSFAVAPDSFDDQPVRALIEHYLDLVRCHPVRLRSHLDLLAAVLQNSPDQTAVALERVDEALKPGRPDKNFRAMQVLAAIAKTIPVVAENDRLVTAVAAFIPDSDQNISAEACKTLTVLSSLRVTKFGHDFTGDVEKVKREDNRLAGLEAERLLEAINALQIRANAPERPESKQIVAGDAPAPALGGGTKKS